MTERRTLPASLLEGRSEPLGSCARDGGINFAVFSEHASAVSLCIFDTSGVRELRRYALHGPIDGVFHGFLPDFGAGLVYGLRADGPYHPEHGKRFNHHKVLLDPWAREIVGQFGWRAEHHGYELGHPEGPRSFDERDNAASALKARVAPPPSIAPGYRNMPRHRAADVVLYEVHVKGFSMMRDDIPASIRGSFAALAHPASVAHFKTLGVTTLSLLPVNYAIDESGVVERGMSNYWGYNTVGFFALNPRLASQENRHEPAAAADEFRHMVNTLHENGIEVVLDVVFNHTAEGSEFGPTISFRGLDNQTWYRLMADDRSRYENLTGCGNTLNVEHPRVTQFVLDALRYWVMEMGVDGFRFDLAPVLGRGHHGFDPSAAFFVALQQDPVLAKARLIAEPWDAAYDGYQVGRFPRPFVEWNDKFRDAVRGYWLRTGVSRGEFARRFTGSSDLFHHGGRRPTASVNFVSAHDGFTLADVVSYQQKHNEANGEGNRDGREHEPSANLGVEGPSTDAAILTQRSRLTRAMLATLLLAQGTPMLCAGDEIGKTQQGNNNAYCQDNALSWLDWSAADPSLVEFVAMLTRLRRQSPLLHHCDWLHTPHHANAGVLVSWHTAAGEDMQPHDWHAQTQHAFACHFRWADDAAAGEQIMICFNPETTPATFHLATGDWRLVCDTSALHAEAAAVVHRCEVGAHSLIVLRVLGLPCAGSSEAVAR